MNDMSVEFIDGYLAAISEGCCDTDYSPLYGAESFTMENDDVKESLRQHLSRDWSNQGDIANFQEIQDVEWEEELNLMLEKWIDEKYFENQASALGDVFENFKINYKESIEDFVTTIVGKTPACFSVNLFHDTYGDECEAIGFVGNGQSFFIYFGWSD